MRKIIETLSAAAAITLGLGAIIFAGHWLANQDIIMGHRGYQEPYSIIFATWLAGFSLVATLAFGIAAFTPVFARKENDAKRNGNKRGCLFGTLFVVTSLIALFGFMESQSARQHLLLQRIRSGEMSDDELRKATKSPNMNVKSYAMDELRKRGRVPPLWD